MNLRQIYIGTPCVVIYNTHARDRCMSCGLSIDCNAGLPRAHVARASRCIWCEAWHLHCCVALIHGLRAVLAHVPTTPTFALKEPTHTQVIAQARRLMLDTATQRQASADENRKPHANIDSGHKHSTQLDRLGDSGKVATPSTKRIKRDDTGPAHTETRRPRDKNTDSATRPATSSVREGMHSTNNRRR